ncbi:helix-turn-helix transcriptional regulator [Verrucomicrobiota bacterium sgz303538]
MNKKMKAAKKATVAPLTALSRLLQMTDSRSTWRNTVARVRYIHEQVRNGKYPNCQKLAEHFEISRRTINRDIEAMRNSLDLPLEFSVPRNGYYYTRPVPSDLPRPKLSSGDMLSFCLARRALERFRGTDFAELFEGALRTIMDEVEGDVALEWQALDDLLSFGPRGLREAPAQEIAAAVAEGLVQQRELELLYRKLDGSKHEPRRIQPLHLRALGDALFLFALDPQRSDGKVRSFVLSRMKDVRVTSREFVRPEKFDPDEAMKHSVGAYAGTEPVTVRLRLSAMAARFLEERPLHPTQKIVRSGKKTAKRGSGAAAVRPGKRGGSADDDGASAELTMHVALTPELEQKILYWGLHVEVLEPASLREGIAGTARAIASRAGF